MKNKTLRLMTLALGMIMVMAFSGVAQARGPMGGHGAGHGNGYNGVTLTPEQQAAAQKMYDEHYAATDATRQQMIIKQAELRAAMVSTNPDSAKIESLSKEIGALRGKMMVERNNLNAKMTKAGLPGGRGMGMGHGGGMGHGMGMKHGGGMGAGGGMRGCGNW